MYLKPLVNYYRWMKTLKALPAGENAVVKYRLIVAHDAPNKDMPAKFQYQIGQSLVWTRLEADISIRTAGAILTVDTYQTTPEKIQPGDTINVDPGIFNEEENLNEKRLLHKNRK